MPVPEGLESGLPAGSRGKGKGKGKRKPPKEGLQDPPTDDIINPSEREEVVLVPLYGLVHDSPIITAVQKATRRGRKGRAADFVDETQWIDAAVVPFLQRIVDKFNELEEKDKEKKKK